MKTKLELSVKSQELVEDWNYHVTSISSNLMVSYRYGNEIKRAICTPIAFPILLTVENKNEKPVELFPLFIPHGTLEKAVNEAALISNQHGDVFFAYSELVSHEALLDISPSALLNLTKVAMCENKKELLKFQSRVRQKLISSKTIPIGVSTVLVYAIGSCSYSVAQSEQSNFQTETLLGDIINFARLNDKEVQGIIEVSNRLSSRLREIIITPTGVKIVSADVDTISQLSASLVAGTRMMEQVVISDCVKEFEDVKNLELTLHASSIGTSRLSVYLSGYLIKSVPISLSISDREQAEASYRYTQTLCDLGYRIYKTDQFLKQKFPHIDFHFKRALQEAKPLVN